MAQRLFRQIHILTDDDLGQLARPLDERYVGKVVFECSVCPNPEKFWDNDIKMIRYCYGRQQKLIDLGLADDEFFESIREQNDPSVILAIEIEAGSLRLNRWFDLARYMQLVDIYLYKNGNLIEKYD